ncbi:hypothetical protein [Deinococcus pimensis]|uniref:hypothetical protein n=1 Tax=Deinococcus pimensis TaxID=309888 RepID=UPI0004B20E9C|nr:hypothetical protein [Deinococcus pimensis]
MHTALLASRVTALLLVLTGFLVILTDQFDTGRTLCVLGLTVGLPSLLHALRSRTPRSS